MLHRKLPKGANVRFARRLGAKPTCPNEIATKVAAALLQHDMGFMRGFGTESSCSGVVPAVFASTHINFS
jgi:hypothetical protein